MEQSVLETVSLWLATNNNAEHNQALPFPELESRQEIFDMTRKAQSAVLVPADAGAWSHQLRAALAARIAAANDNPYLAAVYGKAAAGSAYAQIAEAGFIPQDAVQQTVVGFMDKVANHTRDVGAADVSALQQAGIADADIVRLCELNAFLAYQIRVAAGLTALVAADEGQAS